jgi:hypothetical protein
MCVNLAIFWGPHLETVKALIDSQGSQHPRYVLGGTCATSKGKMTKPETCTLLAIVYGKIIYTCGYDITWDLIGYLVAITVEFMDRY